jgi:glutamate N-acetyltransferase/amino-acid N-acetyltransferase
MSGRSVARRGADATIAAPDVERSSGDVSRAELPGADLSAADLPGADLPVVEERPGVPGGFVAGGASIGIKASGRPDLALFHVRDGPAAVAAVFTTNAVPAAPVRLNRRHLAGTEPAGNGRYGWVDVIASTSGSANAGTGPDGDRDQEEIAEALAKTFGTTAERTLALSTGIIGVRLPVDVVKRGIAALAERGLGDDAEHFEAAARAFMTTDTRPKLAGVSLEVPRPGATHAFRVAGLAKGVGMIHPQMATMLSVVLTDARAEPGLLYELLRPIVARTWNQLSVDGDRSTNDTVFLAASGASRGPSIARNTPAADALARGVEAVARSLARQQAADGEGAQTLLTCAVTGGRDSVEARAVARAVVSSSLVKAAIHGRDPNWGRILAAAGNAELPSGPVLEAAGLEPADAQHRAGSPVAIDADRLQIWIGGTKVFAGIPLQFDRPAVASAMDSAEVVVRVDLGAGTGSGEAFGCDLTETYVIENSAYTT